MVIPLLHELVYLARTAGAEAYKVHSRVRRDDFSPPVAWIAPSRTVRTSRKG